MSAIELYQLTHFNIERFFFTQSKLFKMFALSDAVSEVLSRLLALLVLVLISPLLLIIALSIKITTRGDIFYSQIRVGKDGKEFKIYKFTSMVKDAEAKTGAVLATENDERITKIGKVLRKSHLDELPQLFNVVLGDMAFIGPRPERPVFVAEFDKTVIGYRLRKEVKPGITGLAQICLPYDATAQEKIFFDRFYIDNRHSVLFNLLIAYYTAKKMVLFFKFRGLYQYREQQIA